MRIPRCSTALAMALAMTCALAVAGGCDSGGGGGEAADTAGGGDTSAPADTATGGDTGPADDTGGGADTATAGDTSEPACNPITQTGCEEQQNCTYGSGQDTPECVASGPKATGEACDGANGCDKGICLSINQTDFLCYQFCKIDAHCGQGVQCLDLTDAPYSVCEIKGIYDTCDLLDQASCGQGKGCYVVSGEPEPVCLPAGNAAQGEPCGTTANECAGNLLCVGSTCHRICDGSQPQPCGDEFTACVKQWGDAGYCDE